MIKKFRERWNRSDKKEQPVTKSGQREDYVAEYIKDLKSMKEIYNKNQIFVSSSRGISTSNRNIKVVLGTSTENTDRLDEYFEDPEIKRLQLVMLVRNPQNVRWAYTHDDDCITSNELLNAAITGEIGLTCTSDNEKLQTYITEYLKAIGLNRIQDWTIKDNHCFARSVFWKDYDMEKMMIIPQHVDYVTLTPVENILNGLIKYVQVTSVDPTMPKGKSRSAFKDYDPYLDYLHQNDRFNVGNKSEIVKVNLMSDEVITFSFFTTPPMDTLVDLVIWKLWMSFDAKLAGQRTATPILDATVDLDQLYDIDTDDYDGLMNHISNQLLKLQQGGIITHSDRIKIQGLNQGSDKYDFAQFLEYAAKKVHKTLLVPYNLLDASGSELATSRSIKSMFDIVIKSIRQKFRDQIHDLVIEQLNFAGIKYKKDEFKLAFSELNEQAEMSQSEEFDKVMQMFDRGMIRDANEVRKYVGKFGMEFEELTEEELQMKAMEQQQAAMQENGEPTGDTDEDGEGGEESDEELEAAIFEDIQKELGNSE